MSMNENTGWDEFFLSICDTVCSKSKDNSTKVGSVIVGTDNEIRSVGFNGFPRRVDETIAERFERPLKYMWTEHAERNAIYNAAQMGTALKGCRIYINSLLPCTDCARAIIQSGIVEVIVSNDEVPERWKESMDIAKTMLKEAGIEIRVVKNR